MFWLKSCLSVPFVCGNWHIRNVKLALTGISALRLSGICSLRAHIPCPCREGPCKKVDRSCGFVFCIKRTLESIPLSPGFRRYAPTSRPPAAGYANRKKECHRVNSWHSFFLFAVRAGFEPAVRLPVRQFSKLVVSATHPSHQADPFSLTGLQR